MPSQTFRLLLCVHLRLLTSFVCCSCHSCCSLASLALCFASLTVACSFCAAALASSPSPSASSASCRNKQRHQNTERLPFIFSLGRLELLLFCCFDVESVCSSDIWRFVTGVYALLDTQRQVNKTKQKCLGGVPFLVDHPPAALS